MRKVTEKDIEKLVGSGKKIYEDRYGFAVPMFGYRHAPNATIIYPDRMLEQVMQSHDDKSLFKAIDNGDAQFGYTATSQAGKTKFYISNDPEKWTHCLRNNEIVEIKGNSYMQELADDKKALIKQQKILDTQIRILEEKQQQIKQFDDVYADFKKALEELQKECPIPFMNKVKPAAYAYSEDKIRTEYTSTGDIVLPENISDQELEQGHADKISLSAYFTDIRQNTIHENVTCDQYREKANALINEYKELCHNRDLQKAYSDMLQTFQDNAPEAMEKINYMIDGLAGNNFSRDITMEAQDILIKENGMNVLRNHMADLLLDRLLRDAVMQAYDNIQTVNMETSPDGLYYIIHPNGTSDIAPKGTENITFNKDDVVVNIYEPVIKYLNDGRRKEFINVTDAQKSTLTELSNKVREMPDHPLSQNKDWGEYETTHSTGGGNDGYRRGQHYTYKESHSWPGFSTDRNIPNIVKYGKDNTYGLYNTSEVNKKALDEIRNLTFEQKLTLYHEYKENEDKTVEELASVLFKEDSLAINEGAVQQYVQTLTHDEPKKENQLMSWDEMMDDNKGQETENDRKDSLFPGIKEQEGYSDGPDTNTRDDDERCL